MQQPPRAREWLVPVLELIPLWVSPLQLTLLRATLTVPVILLRDAPWLAVWILILSSAFDFLDGELARHRNQVTELGATLDAFADKIFVLGCLFYACDNRIDPWIASITLTIELFLLAVRFIEWQAKVTTKSGIFGKIKTWVQSFGIAFVLTREPFFEACAKVVLPASMIFAGLSLTLHLASLVKQRPSASS